MDKFCYSCSAPLGITQFKGPAENYCINCSDKKGTLKSKKDVQIGLAEWFKMWQPDLTSDKAMARALYYMKALPAWAQE